MVNWERQDIVWACEQLGVAPPKNLGDVVYSFRYRKPLPGSVRRRAPEGLDWIIRGTGDSQYQFKAVALAWIAPTVGLVETKVPNATPGIIQANALDDEQALLAILRYNRLIDVFTGITCYSLQNHLRTNVPGIGQTETDEVYVGLDRRGAQYVVPVQAKGGNDLLGVVQVEQDLEMCARKFGSMICRPVAAQFMAGDLIALFEFERQNGEIRTVAERHYRLVSPELITEADLTAYRRRTE